MSATCVSEPVSWLRLERYALGELPGPLAREVAAHLAGCPACRACLDRIERDEVALPALPFAVATTAAARPAGTTARPWWASWWSRLAIGGRPGRGGRRGAAGDRAR
ncbi:MAG: zf-HC2 domain-containing protein [Kofleriaceae bacterium]|nr:zf-HC2 domain-containing protein [Kofleriaceae bacterium]